MKKAIKATHPAFAIFFLLAAAFIAVGLAEGFIEVTGLQSLAKYLGLCVVSVGLFLYNWTEYKARV